MLKDFKTDPQLTNLYVENPKVIVTSTDFIYTVLSLTPSRGQCRLYLFIQ